MEFHILCDPKDIAPYVFVPGDPGRAKKIAAHFDNARFVSDSRGYVVYSGSVAGIPMTVCSTGMGGPQVAIGIEELGHMGARTFIRVGSCGTLQDNIQPGDVVVATGVVRAGATANRYLPPAFPAAPDFGVLTALVEAAGRLGIPVWCYEWMAGFNWVRTSTTTVSRGGSLVTSFDYSVAQQLPPPETGPISEEALWENLRYFLQKVLPVAGNRPGMPVFPAGRCSCVYTGLPARVPVTPR